MQWEQDKIFSNASLYDFAFSWDVSPEVHFFKRFFAANRSHLLIPACGTGRYAWHLARAGYAVTAFDLHPDMLAFSLAFRVHPNIRYRLGDMITFSGLSREAYDGGLLLNNSFRYILKREEAVAHLQNVAERLPCNGIYLLEMGLNDDPALLGSVARWSVRRGDAVLHAQWKLKELDLPYLVDEVTLQLEEEGKCESITEYQPQLSWTLEEFCSAVDETSFSIEAIYNARRERLNNFEQEARVSGKYYVVLKKGVE